MEEIDGVDVKVVDGKVTFVTKKDSKVLKDSNKEKVGDDQESVENESGSDSESELLEFKKLGQYKEGELSAASYSSSDEDEQGNIESSKLTDPSEDVDEDVLKENVFNNINIDDISPVNLPEWTNLAPLSMTILQSLQNLNFLRPTEIQKKSIPVIMQGVDVMGKTIRFR